MQHRMATVLRTKGLVVSMRREREKRLQIVNNPRVVKDNVLERA